MGNNKVKTIALIGITLFTIVLGIIAVVTSYNLRKKATIPVAPNVPQSKPMAASAPTLTNQACKDSFTIAAESLVCNSNCDTTNDLCPGDQVCDTTTKKCRNAACLDQPNCTCPPEPGEVACKSKTVSKGSTVLTSSSEVSPGDTLTYTITIDLSKLNASQSATVKTIDSLPDGLTVTNYSNACTYSRTNNTLTCNTNEKTSTITYTASVDQDATGTLSNAATVEEENSPKTTCRASVNVKETEYVCNSDCTSDTQCPGSLVCDVDTNKCRNASCLDESDCTCASATPTPTPTPTPRPTSTPTPMPGCYDACDVDADCSGSLICDENICVNPSCSGESDCVCEVVQKTELPEAGNFLPTVSILMIALGVLTLGAVGIMGL